MEAWIGVEPIYAILQTAAWPFGYHASLIEYAINIVQDYKKTIFFHKKMHFFIFNVKNAPTGVLRGG